MMFIIFSRQSGKPTKRGIPQSRYLVHNGSMGYENMRYKFLNTKLKKKASNQYKG